MGHLFETVERIHLRVGTGHLPIDLVSANDAPELILASTSQPWSYVVTPNAQHVELLRDDPSLAPIYAESMLSLPDGWPVATLTSWVTRRSVERVAGSDLLEAIVDAAGESRPLALVGGEGGAPMQDLLARLETGGWLPFHEPAPREELHDGGRRRELLERVATSASGGVVVVGVGAPRQELLARELCALPGTGVVLCLGMSINFSSGVTRRAPELVQRLGLEWAHRALQEPRRLVPRYASNLRTILKVTKENFTR